MNLVVVNPWSAGPLYPNYIYQKTVHHELYVFEVFKDLTPYVRHPYFVKSYDNGNKLLRMHITSCKLPEDSLCADLLYNSLVRYMENIVMPSGA